MMMRIRQWLSTPRPTPERFFHPYRQILAERNVALLLGAGFTSEIGDWFNTVALIAVSYEFGEGAVGVGGMLALRMLPRLVFQAPAGVLVDRWSGKRLLFITQFIMAVIAASFVLLVFVPSLWLL